MYRGETHDGRLVAVKLLNQGRPQAEEELLTDIEINSSLKHRHIVALLGYSVDAKHLILVYEFLPKGNLDDHLHGTFIHMRCAPELNESFQFKFNISACRRGLKLTWELEWEFRWKGISCASLGSALQNRCWDCSGLGLPSRWMPPASCT